MAAVIGQGLGICSMRIKDVGLNLVCIDMEIQANYSVGSDSVGYYSGSSISVPKVTNFGKSSLTYVCYSINSQCHQFPFHK